jgi:hypothetical protein
MQSYADRRTHDFFFERDYPDVSVLESVFNKLTAEPQEKETVRGRSSMDEESFDRVLEKLWIHGGAVVDSADNITRGHDQWRKSYTAQSDQKRRQLELMRHFGDLSDSRRPCGICDFCAPSLCIGQRFRPLIDEERETVRRVIASLRAFGSRSTGKLHAELFPTAAMSRNDFEELLASMARSGMLRITSEVFEKDGRTIPYLKARLLGDEGASELLMKAPFAGPRRGRKKKAKRKAKGRGKRR